MRHLYQLPTLGSTTTTTSSDPPPSISSNPTASLPPISQTIKNATIDLAKTFERRRCNHHTLEQPLPELECLQSCIVSPSGENKHRYCVATQDRMIRAYLRSIPGTPLIYIQRSVMILEPMADASWQRREKAEWGKFTEGLKEEERAEVERIARREAGERKRKREVGDDGDTEMRDAGGEGSDDDSDEDGEKGEAAAAAAAVARRGRRVPKQPNPLSVKKAKKLPVRFLPNPPKKKKKPVQEQEPAGDVEAPVKAKKNRRRKHHKKAGEDEGGAAAHNNNDDDDGSD